MAAFSPLVRDFPTIRLKTKSLRGGAVHEYKTVAHSWSLFTQEFRFDTFSQPFFINMDGVGKQRSQKCHLFLLFLLHPISTHLITSASCFL